MFFYTGHPVAFTNDRGEHTEFFPRWLWPNDHRLALVRKVECYESLADYIERERPARVLIHRTFALGDMLMLIPICRAFGRHYGVEVFVATSKDILNAIGGLNWLQEPGLPKMVRSHGIIDYGAPVHINLDKALEGDHDGGEPSYRHRLDLYARALGCTMRWVEGVPEWSAT